MRLLSASFVLALATPALIAQEQQGRDFRWEGAVASGRWVKLQNINGGVEVVAASGDRVEVTAIKRGRRGDPDEVRIEVTRYGTNDENVLICAIWGDATCDESGYRSNRRRNRDHDDNDIEVEFTVRLPRGVNIDVGTVNGSVDVRGVTGEVNASSVNGGVDAISDGGPVTATTVNGSIRASMRTLGRGDLEFSTVNGSITVELPEQLDADLRMTTVNGTLSSRDFPLTVTGRFNPQNMRATIGRGGTRLSFTTVNGNVELRKRA
jgi:Putative adhesin